MEPMKQWLKGRIKNAAAVRKIRGEASVRDFYRVLLPEGSLVAMVYPRANPEEIGRIVKLTEVYRRHHINVPEIKEVIDDRVILQQDLGDLSLQRVFGQIGRAGKKEILTDIADILIRLKNIPTHHTAAVLDHGRLKREMVFFIEHFAGNFLGHAPGLNIDKLREDLHLMVDHIKDIHYFAHRDFHSRNMGLCGRRLTLIDFQDSLKAPPYYDTVSFAFDAYLDLGSLRPFFLDILQKKGLRIDPHQFYLSALQRNIKALGTFGFQVTARKHLSYKKYIPRTLRHLRSNPLLPTFLDKDLFTPPPTL